MPKRLSLLLLLFCINIFANDTLKPKLLYISGDYSSIKYHLGVLSEIERLQIPIDTIVGSDWGAFVGALWSAGWSSKQIGHLVESWDSLPRAKQILTSALWKKEWLIKNKESGEPVFESTDGSKPYFGDIFFELRLQESLWRSDIGSKIPFRKIDDADSYPFPSTANDIRILSTTIAQRNIGGTAAQHYQQKLWAQDSALIILRPHSIPNPDSLYEAGIRAVQTKRSVFAQFTGTIAKVTYTEQAVPEPRFLYHPVFDSISSEKQGHLESFWNPNDTSILGVRNFLEAQQKDGTYRNVKLTLDTSSFLQINAESFPQLSLSLAGFGGTLFGANVAANINFRFVNQFGYNWSLTAFYGQGAKGIEPALRFERLFMDNGDFYAKMKIFEYEPIPYFQKNIYREARLFKEKGSSATLGVEKPLGNPVLQIAVEIERKKITSGASGDSIFDYEYYPDDVKDTILVDIIYEPVTVVSMFPYAKWLLQSENYDRWFAREGFMAELSGGFKGVSVSTSGQSAPLYVSTQGKLGVTQPLSKHISISGGTEFGLNFRRTGRGEVALPEELYGINGYDEDPALENRYRFVMGMGSFQEEWQTPDNASNRYGLIFAGLSFHLRESGIFLTGGFAKDGEPNPYSELKAKRFFAEPKIRIKTETFDLVLGQNIIYSGKSHFFLSAKKDF